MPKKKRANIETSDLINNSGEVSLTLISRCSFYHQILEGPAPDFPCAILFGARLRVGQGGRSRWAAELAATVSQQATHPLHTLFTLTRLTCVLAVVHILQAALRGCITDVSSYFWPYFVGYPRRRRRPGHAGL